MAIGIGIGISFCLQNNSSGTPIVASATGTGTPTLEFTLTTANTYAGVEWGVNPTYSWSVFDAAASTSHTLTLDATDGLVAGTLYIWRPYTNSDPLDGVGTRVYGTGGTVYAATVPGAPTGVTLGTATATTQPISWTAPASDGGSALTDYVVQYGAAGSGIWTTFTDGVGTGVSTTVTGLTASTSYDYRIAAVNAVGTGSYSTTATGSTAAADGVAAPTLTGSPTLLASWDFDKASTITLSGSDIDQISGADGTSYTLLTPGNMPSQSTVSGKKVGTFVAASSEFMQIASACGVGANGCTIILVCQLNSTATQGFVDISDRTATTSRNRHNLIHVTATSGFSYRKGDASGQQEAVHGSQAATGLHMVIGRSPSGTVAAKLNDDGEGTAHNSAGTNELPASLTHTTLGARAASSAEGLYADMDVFRVLIYAGDIGDTAVEEAFVWGASNYGTPNP